MRGFGRAGWLGVVVSFALLAGGASAAKVKVTKVKAESLTPTGSLTYTWSGDPARGCASAGLCGIHGELILRPQQVGGIITPVNEPITVFLNQSGAVRVLRQEGGAVVGECVDLSGSSSALLSLTPSRHRATTAGIEPPPSSGRCAGPTSNDLAGISLPVRPIGGGSVDLTGTRSFTAGPFTGTLVSTMRVLASPSSSQSEGFSSSGPSRPVRVAQAPILELVQLHYQVSAGPSSIRTDFSGTPDPSCQIVDACGTTGSLALAIQPARTLTVFGERTVHSHLSHRQVLDDLRRGRLSLTAFALLSGRVSETFNWPDGSRCSDAVAAPSLLLDTGAPLRPTVRGEKVLVALSTNGSGSGTDVFRTHCPGPDDSDLFSGPPAGESQAYAQGSIATTQLLAKRSVLTLSSSGSFSGLGYAGRRAGSIALDLTLTKVIAHTSR
jgi:hypothetical protein